ncbi:hypothetical protein ALP41_01797 [Pseudomonas savastanoi pv. nerii]|nr:hypothetical protein ALP41_01797 [Pseudomonas savastanoi pv. nerii]
MLDEVKDINGFFDLLVGKVFGILSVDGDKTLLTLRSNSFIPHIEEVECLVGTGFDHKIVSCLRCIGVGSERRFNRGGTEHVSSIFPHYVSVGDAVLNTVEETITEIYFNTNDLPMLFNDSRAFGHIFTSKEALIDLLTHHHEGLEREYSHGFPLNMPEISDEPHIFYFTGKMKIFECATPLGVLSVNHGPSIMIDGKSGISCENDISASIKLSSPVNFDTAYDCVMTFARFFSIMAGRTQALSAVKLRKIGLPENSLLDIYSSFKTPVSGAPIQHFRDIPISPIHRPDEFTKVLNNWLATEPDWGVGRIQYLTGLAKSRSYDTDRLVAAANAFDILPASATVADSLVSEEFESARGKCLEILAGLPKTEDRASAIGVLKRWGRANLRSKVLHRATIVKAQMPQISEYIDDILVMAIKTRNYFVHGSDDFNYIKYQRFLPVFTDALEFVFSVSDLIECGWNSVEWLKQKPSSHHNYGAFLNSLAAIAVELKEERSRK